MRRAPPSVPTLCRSNNIVYSCGTQGCHHTVPCASNRILLKCACAPAGWKDVRAHVGRPVVQAIHREFPCLHVDAKMPYSNWDVCSRYLKQNISEPESACAEWRVPRVLHATGPNGTVPRPVRMNFAMHPSFRAHYMSDEEAGRYISANCDEDVFRAYNCMVAPAYRADIARFCVLHSEGGVYVDADIILTRPVDAVVSMCRNATVGDDFPWMSLGKQMKVLAGVRGHPLFKCMLDRIVDHVRRRVAPRRNTLALTGPSLLHECFVEMQRRREPIEVTYRDTRGAMWPFSGLMGRRGLVAFEDPKPSDYASSAYEPPRRRAPSVHYSDLLAKGRIYTRACPL